MNKAEELHKLETACHRCRKCAIGGKRLDGLLANVFSNMCVKARIVVVGQNPGEIEVRKSRPFVGPSGTFFDKCIKEVVGIDRSSLYITNVIHCFSPNNRAPKPNEIENCRPQFLDNEIDIIKPNLIITLGSYALKEITGMSGIMKIQGNIQFSVRYKVDVLPLYHPSPLNMKSVDRRKDFMEAIKKIGDYLCKRA